jgi:hypothetical protein
MGSRESEMQILLIRFFYEDPYASSPAPALASTILYFPFPTLGSNP